MTKFPFPACAAILLAVGLCATSCDRKAAPATSVEATPQATPDQQGFKFGDGFYKEEFTPTATFRWARQTASAHFTVAAAGRYQLIFRPVTVFSPRENTIAVSINGGKIGEASTHTFDFANPQTTKLQADLKAGDNEVILKSDAPEVQLGQDDPRKTSFGLIMPVGAEKVP